MRFLAISASSFARCRRSVPPRTADAGARSCRARSCRRRRCEAGTGASTLRPGIQALERICDGDRLELERHDVAALNIQEHALVTARSSDHNPEAAFVEYLHALYGKRKPDLIVSIGAPAAAFVQRHRAQLFPAAPMVLTVVDQRRLKFSALGPTMSRSPSTSTAATVRNILQILPDTRTIAMVVAPRRSNDIGKLKSPAKPSHSRIASTSSGTTRFPSRRF